MAKRKLTPITELLKTWIEKGVEEIYGFSGRAGMVFKVAKDELEYYQSTDEVLGYITPKGYLVEDGGYRVGQLVHPQFGWE